MSDKDSQQTGYRAPATPGETLLANFRPQPAIPALIVFVLTIFIPVLSAGPGAATGADGSFLLLLIPVGIAVSCGLAVAAGFCSLFPPAAWIAIAIWAFRFTRSGPLPGYNRMVLLAGIVTAAVMILVQVWRVRTGRFRPTVRIDDEE